MEKKKYIVVLGDGMADFEDENGQTPLSLAKKPIIDALCGLSELGLVKTVPDGFSPGSDVANLSVMGYNPKEVYSGRSPLEAASIGINLGEKDVTYRLNFVTLSGDEKFEDKVMLDYSADEIPSKDAAKLIELIRPIFEKHLEVYAGTSYRNALVWRDKGKKTNANLTPPHDISDKVIGEYLPPEPFLSIIKAASEVLTKSPQNKTKANAVWLWGEGTKPKLQPFEEKFSLKGTVISEVDLVRGIGLLAKMQSVVVKGADATIDTNYKGLVKATLNSLKNSDFVYLHIEAPDEMGHKGDKDGKVLAIEYLDSKVFAPLLKGLDKLGYPFRILFTPDHETPVSLKTHTGGAVPFFIYDSELAKENHSLPYTEAAAKSTSVLVGEGHTLLNRLFDDN